MPTRYQNAVYRRECRQLPRSRVSSSLPDRDSSKVGDSSPAAAAARTRRLQHPTTSTRLSRHPIVAHTYPGTHTHTRQAFPMPLPTAISPKSKRRGREKVEGCDQPRHRAGCLFSSPPLPPLFAMGDRPKRKSVVVCRRQKACGTVPSLNLPEDPPPHSSVPNRRRAAVSRPRGPRTYTAYTTTTIVKTGRREMSSRSPEHDAAAQKEK